MPEPEQRLVEQGGQPTSHPEVVQYVDGERALVFRGNGNGVQLGPKSTFKYTRDFLKPGMDMAIITTKDGNQCVIGGGLILDKNSGHYWPLPTEASGAIATFDVTVGEVFGVPNVGHAKSNVEAVLVRYKKGGPGDAREGMKLNVPSPFPALEKYLQAINDARN